MSERPVALMARLLDCTEGQVFTMLIGMTLALLLAVPGIPAVLRDRPSQAPALPPATDDAPTALTPSPVRPPVSTPPPTPRGDASPASTFVAPPSSPPTPPAPPAEITTPPDVTVATPAPGSIRTFARVGHPGAPGGLAVADDGTVFVTTDNGSARGGPGPSRVFAYDGDGTPTADHAIAGQPQDRRGGLAGVAVEPGSGALAVLDPEGARIIGIDMGSGTQSVLATIPDLPACLVPLGTGLCQPGIEDRAPFPVSAIYDEDGTLYVTDPAQDTLWRLRPRDEAPEVWYQSVYFSAGDGPYGLAMGAGVVEFTVGTSHDPAAFDAGALYRLTINPGGSAGALTLVHAFPQGDRPGSLALASSGAAYVVLRSSSTIVTIAPDGSQTSQIDPPGTGPIPLDSPSAVALVSGALLVANGRTSDDPDRWAVLTIAVNDGPTAAVHDDRRRTSANAGGA
ncbi:MAG: hypothetical protein KY469_17870 [Actinobacteria bacterium]|nr:hypothetical protein [Actinomycetota bacterium]